MVIFYKNKKEMQVFYVYKKQTNSSLQFYGKLPYFHYFVKRKIYLKNQISFSVVWPHICMPLRLMLLICDLMYFNYKWSKFPGDDLIIAKVLYDRPILSSLSSLQLRVARQSRLHLGPGDTGTLFIEIGHKKSIEFYIYYGYWSKD
jgi:hypothetical protein